MNMSRDLGNVTDLVNHYWPAATELFLAESMPAALLGRPRLSFGLGYGLRRPYLMNITPELSILSSPPTPHPWH